VVGECAAELENCRPDYLEENELSGCCEGTRCKLGPGDVPICQVADAEELALAMECSRFSKTGDSAKLELQTTTLATSAGNITLPSSFLGSVDVGPAGCVNGLAFTIGTGVECSFEFDVSLSAGKLVLKKVRGHLQGCAGYTGDPSDSFNGFLQGVSNTPLGELSFEGTACEAPLFSTFESYCVTGAFDLLIDGQWDFHALEEQHLVFSGSLCSAQPLGDCPAP
jgi:hypothetical protein